LDDSFANDIAEATRQPPTGEATRSYAYSLRAFFLGVGVVAAAMFFAAWPWAIHGRAWFMDPEWSMWKAKEQIIDHCNSGDTIILGDSRSMAGLIPAMLGDNVTNLALGASTSIENYYVARRVLACPTPPKRALIAFLPIDMTRTQMYWQRTALFGLLDFEQMEEVRKSSIRISDPLIYSANPVGTVLDKLQNYSYHIGFPSYYFPAMMNAGFVGRKALNEREFENTLRDRGHHYFGTAAQSNRIAEDAQVTAFAPSPLLNDYFERLLTALRDSKTDVYFLTPPLNPATFALVPQDVIADFKAYLNDVAARHPNFHLLGDIVQSMPADHFGDEEHLNEKGAAAWTEIVRGLLAKAGT
jgi:hypothetical protein